MRFMIEKRLESAHILRSLAHAVPMLLFFNSKERNERQEQKKEKKMLPMRALGTELVALLAR